MYDPYAADVALAWGFIYFSLIIGLIVYIYMSIALMTIAKKTNTENGWLAWIPIANYYLMTQITKKPGWWVILLFIPIVNIVITILLWMEIAVARGKESWWGVLMLIPAVNLFVPGYLAFSE